jgi:uncharacterized membrane protein
VKEFLKTTIVGGALFLLPLGLVLFILGYALRLATGVAQPISKALHLDQLGDLAGIGITTVVGVLLLVLVSFAAGIVARTSIGGRISGWFEGSLLSALPQYQMMKSMAEGLAQIEGDTGIRPALINIEDGWQIGYILEVLENGWLAVFLPQAPTPMSGNVMYLEADRVRPLGITMVQAMGIVKRIGVGSGQALHGVDLALPEGAFNPPVQATLSDPRSGTIR